MLDENSPILTVSKVAKELNISTDRLRTYDEEKLVMPTRIKNNIRMYSCNDVNWLECLRKLIGKSQLSISGFKEILKLIYFMADSDFDKLNCTFVIRDANGADLFNKDAVFMRDAFVEYED